MYKNKIPLFWAQTLTLLHMTVISYRHFCLGCASHYLQFVSGLFTQLKWVRSESV